MEDSKKLSHEGDILIFRDFSDIFFPDGIFPRDPPGFFD